MTMQPAAADAVEMSGLDAPACADALASSHAALMDAERLQVELVAHWCDLNSSARTCSAAPGRVLPGAERMVVVGGDGTPVVREFAAAELGLLLDSTTTAAVGLMRDVLDLRHRHPRLYALVGSGQARFFQARQVARATRSAALDLDQARHVDERVAPFIGQLTWGRLMALVEAAVIEADPEAAEQRRIAADMQRFVRTGRSSEFGTTMIYARARAGEAIFFLAMCDRIAQILKLRRSLEVAGHVDRCPDATGSPDAQVEMDVLRSEAVGILASPVAALALLQWAEEHATDGDSATDSDAEPTDDNCAEADLELFDTADGESVTLDPPEWDLEPDPEPEEDGEDLRRPVVVLDGSLDPAAFRPRAVLYVHLSEESFRRWSRGAGRVEGVGPVTMEQSVDFLRHCQVTVRPVIDLNADPSADGYEVSPLVRETMVLRDPIECFPWGTLPSRKADADHRRPYRHDAATVDDAGLDPPGSRGPQTHADNLQPLGRLHHRLKTHGGWACTSPERGVQLWRSPTGHWARVDRTGTSYLGRLEDSLQVQQVHAGNLSLLTSG